MHVRRMAQIDVGFNMPMGLRCTCPVEWPVFGVEFDAMKGGSGSSAGIDERLLTGIRFLWLGSP